MQCNGEAIFPHYGNQWLAFLIPRIRNCACVEGFVSARAYTRLMSTTVTGKSRQTCMALAPGLVWFEVGGSVTLRPQKL